MANNLGKNINLGSVDNVIDLNELTRVATEKGMTVGSVSLWAVVTANDSVGLIIDNLKAGDEVIIESANGVASFKETSMKSVKSLITVLGAVSTLGADILSEGELAPFNSEFEKGFDAIKAAVPDKIVHAVRDAWGEDPGTGDYAKHEGGLIVCMPAAHGALYASSENYLASGAKKHGRKKEYFSKNIIEKESFFPCNCAGGVLQQKTSFDGPINILAFDSKFKDNAGFYEFKATIRLAR